jgi:hypothetical protein
MPRFGIKTLLIGTAVFALWLSTLSGYAAGNDVRRSILLLILVASAFAAIYGRGRRRAFWSGFFAVMLLCGGADLQRPLHRYLPDFAWLVSPVPNTAAYQVWSPARGQLRVSTPATAAGPTVFAAPSSTPQPVWIVVVSTAWILILSLAGGFIATYLFGQSRRLASQESDLR